MAQWFYIGDEFSIISNLHYINNIDINDNQYLILITIIISKEPVGTGAAKKLSTT